MRSLIVLSLLLLPTLLQAAPTRYSIGNSLTTDSNSSDPNWRDLPVHIRGAASIDFLWNNPDDPATVYRPNKWPVELLNDYDVMTLQPHVTGTFASDIAAIQNFQNYATGVDQTYLIMAWPRQSRWSPTYSDWWLSEVTYLPGIQTHRVEMKRAYFDMLFDATEAWIVPTGEVFYELEQRGYDLSSLYLDDIHLSAGRDIANATLRAVVNQEYPSLRNPDPNIEAIIYDVIRTHPQAGYSDFNRDGIVNGLDLQVWENGYGTKYSGEHFLNWQLTLGSTIYNSQISTLPEPGTTVLLLIALIGVFSARQAR